MDEQLPSDAASDGLNFKRFRKSPQQTVKLAMSATPYAEKVHDFEDFRR